MLPIAEANEAIVTRLIAMTRKVEMRLRRLEARSIVSPSELKSEALALQSDAARPPELDFLQRAQPRSILL